jgi:ankyrin repeat protein
VKPLYNAAGNEKPDMVQFLLERGADIHLGSGRFATGPTALWTAISLKSLDSIRILLQHGGPVYHVEEEIRSISGLMTVVLQAKTEGYVTSVRLETEESAKEYLRSHKEN